MKAGAKTILAVLGLAAIAGGAYAFSTSHNEDPPPPDAPDPGAPGNQKTGGDFVPPQPKPPANNVISPFALADFDVIVSPSNRALVTKMQKMLGITADGVWGIQTAAALGRYGLVNGFTLRTLQTKMQSTPKWLRGFNGGLLGI